MRARQQRREYLSVSETARETAMSEAFWRRAVFRHQIPVVRFGRRVLIRRCDLEAFVRSRRVPAQATAKHG
jgi:excisionase family DNA binding protein